MTQTIILDNRSSLLPQTQLASYVGAWQTQLNDHLRAFWPDTPIFALQLGSYQPGAGGVWGLIFEDTTTQRGDLGYHDRESGSPVARVDVQACMQFNSLVSVVGGHELCEMAADPLVQTVTRGTWGMALCEVCDPFIVTASTYHISNVEVPNFTSRSYWGLGPAARFDMKDTVKQPFPFMPDGGYSIVMPPGGSWTTHFATAGCSEPEIAWIRHCADTSLRCQVVTARHAAEAERAPTTET